MKRLGPELRRLRVEAGLGLRETARRAEISAAHLSRIETSDEKSPSEETIGRLVSVLGGDLDELLQLAGRIPSDVREMLLADPGLVALLRGARKRALSGAMLVRRVFG